MSLTTIVRDVHMLGFAHVLFANARLRDSAPGHASDYFRFRDQEKRTRGMMDKPPYFHIRDVCMDRCNTRSDFVGLMLVMSASAEGERRKRRGGFVLEENASL